MESNRGNPQGDIHTLKDYKRVLTLPFPENIDDTVEMLDTIISEAAKLCGKILTDQNGKVKITDKGFLRNFFSPYAREIEYISGCVEKANSGIQKLNSMPAVEHPGLSLSIIRLGETLAALKHKGIPQLKQLSKKKKIRNYAITFGVVVFHIIFYSWLFKHL